MLIGGIKENHMERQSALSTYLLQREPFPETQFYNLANLVHSRMGTRHRLLVEQTLMFKRIALANAITPATMIS